MEALAFGKSCPTLTSEFIRRFVFVVVHPSYHEAVLGEDIVPFCSKGSSAHLLIKVKRFQNNSVHFLFQPVVEFHLLLSLGDFPWVGIVSGNGTDLFVSGLLDGFYLVPLDLGFLLVQDILMLLLEV